MNPAVRLHNIVMHTKALGPQNRMAIWFQGCTRHCKGCMSPQSRPVNGGRVIPVQDLIHTICSADDIEGITISGGEPFLQTDALYLLLHLMHHFLQTGVGLRQVCDWACLLARHGRSLDGAALAADLRALGMLRPAAALARIVVDELGVPAGVVPAELLGAARGADVRLLLADILASGNFGHDTPQMRGFRRGAHLHNARNYAAALMRHARIFRLCPREVAAYPFVWLKNRRQGDEA